MATAEAEDEARGSAAELAARLDRLPTTRTIWTIIVLLSIAYFFELYEQLLTGFVAPGLTASGLFSATTRGWFGTSGIAAFIAALFSGLTVGTLITGPFADRFGRRAVFTWALLLYVAMTAIMAFQTTAPAIELFRFLAGIGLGMESVIIDTYIAELVPREARGRAFACSQAVGFCAMPLGAFLAWLLVPHAPLGLDGWRWVVLIGAAMALGGWYIRLRLPESPRWLAEQGRLAEAEAVVAVLERRVAEEHGGPLPVPVPSALVPRKGRYSEMWRPPYRRRTLMMIVFNIFQTVGYYGFLNWVPTLLIAQGITVTKSLAYTVLIALTAPLGPVIGLAIGERIERKWMVVGSMAVLAAVGLLFSATRIPALLIACGMLLTTFQNIMSYSYHAYQAELFPTRIRAKAVGFVYSFSRMSQIANAFVIAFVLGRFGAGGVFMLIALAYLVVIVVTSAFGPRTSGRALEEISG